MAPDERDDDTERPLVWLHGAIQSPPWSRAARVEAGYLLRRLQAGESLGMPHSRPLPSIGARCHELRTRDVDAGWRIVHRIDPDAVVILAIFPKGSREIPAHILRACRLRLRRYDEEDD